MFRFKLQRVLDLRARKERDAATALAAAQAEAEAAREAQRRLEATRAELAQQATPGAAPSVGALRNLGFLLERLDEQVAGAAEASATAAGAVSAREDALRAAFRDRRTLDRLKEKHEGAWRAGEIAQDRALMDEIALTRFTTQGQAARAAGPDADAEAAS
ncbi:flagellar export protein FliJ [Roseisolibacter sp. H3M3-2]|uniref:flagellar export protein FliJ n=1 Tax=Roseisolibacter sp. H3M3-2 TaxID=3031323 RepID=UPI0023DAD8E5|nr:flagellar export protein FliJ [Roseisolibacter sp. H3M3-2]MDF1504972.1 flagellar export protein FliJ [Roseisolibacter sp. H3M3-2]